MPQHAAPYIKTLLQQSNPRITVQKMCDDCPTLVKSTVDKFLAGQIADTSWSNVATMVRYLGGSLDELAEIRARSAASPSTPLPVSAPPQPDLPHGLTIEGLLDRFRVNHVDARNALVQQHTAALEIVKKQCDDIIVEKNGHLASMEKGRNFWRTLSCVLMLVIVAAAIWLVWEFSNFDKGLTGYYLRMLMQSVSGGNA